MLISSRLKMPLKYLKFIDDFSDLNLLQMDCYIQVTQAVQARTTQSMYSSVLLLPIAPHDLHSFSRFLPKVSCEAVACTAS